MQVTEIFYSIQGEGSTIGSPTVFIRTTGCNLRCVYCDTTYAYTSGKKMEIKKILEQIKTYPCDQICITGGEPLLQEDLKELINGLVQNKKTIILETNGSQSIQEFTHYPSLIISMDLKTPSSNMNEHMNLKNIKSLRVQDQLKCIINDKKDYQYAKNIINEYHPNCIIFFQPVWGTDTSKLASWMLEDHLSVRLGIQLHKIIWGENTHC